VPFPSSEYGGQIIVIAKSEEEAIYLIKQDCNCIRDLPDYNDRIESHVKESMRYPLFVEHESKVVEAFIT
jgi:hypothetical protein